jgi:hypothetical protein
MLIRWPQFIAINLQLVVVHGINTAKWTKWYLGSAAFAAVVIPIPSSALRGRRQRAHAVDAPLQWCTASGAGTS